ncbi:hypothetical protein [Enterobacter chuandaensis]|uniref:hypothetical protein n=1 Tax=Enterobacter chuandaensis TaxID=2497875 RepID=UPI003B30CAD4
MKIINVMLCGLTLLFSSGVLSEECQIALSQPTLSFGRFRQDDIAASRKNWNRMPAREVMVNVFCPQPRVMALFVQSTSGFHGGILFGNEGRLALVADKMTVDGQHYDVVKTTDRVGFTSTDSPKEKVFLKSNEGLVARQNSSPVRGKQMSVTIGITPVLNDNLLRRVSDNTELESILAWELLTTD